MRHPFGETVTIIRKSPGGEDDPYGDPIESTETRIDVPGCAVAPAFSTEPTDRGRAGIVVGYTIYPPYGAGFRFTDQVEIPSVTMIDAEGHVVPARLEIDGDPIDWKNAINGERPGGEVAVKRAQG